MKELGDIARMIFLCVIQLVIIGAIKEQTDVQTLNAFKPLGPAFGVDLSMVEILLGSLFFIIIIHCNNIARQTPRHRKDWRRPDLRAWITIYF
ncbi:UNVERIFIED_ORG: hypothetical protein OKW15_000414 [Pseudomonas reinekei]|nr:hypothetical protein [Pseudomonas reinekei]